MEESRATDVSLWVHLGSCLGRPGVSCLLWHQTCPDPPQWAAKSPEGQVKVDSPQGREDLPDVLQAFASVVLVSLDALPLEQGFPTFFFSHVPPEHLKPWYLPCDIILSIHVEEA